MPSTRCGCNCLMSSFTWSTTNDWYAALGACWAVKTTSRSASSGTSHSPGRPAASGQKYSPSGSKMTVPTFACPQRDRVTGSVAYSRENSSLIRLDLPNPALAKTKLRRETSCETWNFGKMAGHSGTIQSSAPARGSSPAYTNSPNARNPISAAVGSPSVAFATSLSTSSEQSATFAPTCGSRRWLGTKISLSPATRSTPSTRMSTRYLRYWSRSSSGIGRSSRTARMA